MLICVECEVEPTETILCARCEKELDARIARHAVEDSFKTVFEYLLAGSNKEAHVKVEESGAVKIEIYPKGDYRNFPAVITVNAVEVKEVA